MSSLALDHTGWQAHIRADAEQELKTAQAQLGRVIPGAKLTKSQARALVEALRDIVEVLAEADPEDKAELYFELGVHDPMIVRSPTPGRTPETTAMRPGINTRPSPPSETFSAKVISQAGELALQLRDAHRPRAKAARDLLESR